MNEQTVSKSEGGSGDAVTTNGLLQFVAVGFATKKKQKEKKTPQNK
jgi:hypothetical protein